MFRRSVVSVFALAVAFAAGAALASRPVPAAAQPAAAQPVGGHGKCIGVAAAMKTPGWVSVYRAFEDGTVEATDDGPATDRTPEALSKWKRIGK
jgi:hypothetical protein